MLKAKRKNDHPITAGQEEEHPPTAKEYDTSKESTAKFLSKGNRNQRAIESDASYKESNDEESKQGKRTARKSTSRRSRSASNESSCDNKPIKNDKKKVKEMSIIEEEKKG